MASSALTAALARVRGQQQPDAAGKGKAEALPGTVDGAPDAPVMVQMTEAEAEALAAQSVAEGRAAERARISGILGHAEAEGRQALAQHLAFETDQTVEAAAALLGKSAKEAAPEKQGKHPLDRIMRAENLPEPPLAGGDAPGGDASTQAAAQILNARAKWRGGKTG